MGHGIHGVTVSPFGKHGSVPERAVETESGICSGTWDMPHNGDHQQRTERCRDGVGHAFRIGFLQYADLDGAKAGAKAGQHTPPIF